VSKQTNEVHLIDIAIPGDLQLSQKSLERRKKYMDLRIEIMRVWKCRRAFVIPIIVGTLGSIPKDLPLQLEKLQLPVSRITTLQKCVLYATTSLLRRYFTV